MVRKGGGEGAVVMSEAKARRAAEIRAIRRVIQELRRRYNVVVCDPPKEERWDDE